MGDNEDLTARIVDDIDPELLAFIRAKVNTFIKWDLARFFHDNPYTIDTAANIARYTGRARADIEEDLQELVAAGVLMLSNMGDYQVYALVSDPSVRAMIGRFVLACEDRQFRVKAMYTVIRGMG